HARASLVEASDVLHAEAVAAHPMRHAGDHGAASTAQERRQNRAAGDPVDVVVAEKADYLAVAQRALQPIDRAREARHRVLTVGTPEVAEPRAQKAVRRLRLVYATVDQELRG